MTATLERHDVDWGITAWDPAKHPRDRYGRFTRSRTVALTDAERERGRRVIATFNPKRFASDSEADAYLRSGPDLPPSQAGAVDSYTGDAFLDINRTLRSAKGGAGDETVRELRAAMRPLPDDLILTRTVGREAFGAVPLEELAGKKVKDAAFASTALGFEYGGTLGQVVMKIAAPKGTPAVFAVPYSRNPHEREVILGDGMEMAVASVTKNDDFGGYTMTLIVLPKDSATTNRLVSVVRNAEQWPEEAAEFVESVDLDPVQQDWEMALAVLLAEWAAVIAAWIDQLVKAVRRMLGRGEIDLGQLRVDTQDGEDALVERMVEIAESAADRVVDEAADQGVELDPVTPQGDGLRAVARLASELDAERLALSAGAELVRVAHPDVPAAETADRVREHLESLSDAAPKKTLGGALTSAQQQARVATLAAGPVGALYASEVLDRNTCGPCESIHGRFIATTDDLGPLFALYPTAGYVDCEGGLRCRGTVVGVWRPETTKGGRR